MITPRALFTPMLFDLADAKKMFELTSEHLASTILIFPAGVSTVSTELAHAKIVPVSADVAYAQSAYDAEKWVNQMMQTVSLDWERTHSALSNDQKRYQEEIISHWQKIAAAFLMDYQHGLKQGYLVAIKDALKMPWQEDKFKLACCPGVLVEDQTAVLELIKELLRVSHEVRLFPYLLEGEAIKQTLAEVLLYLQQHNYGVELKHVAYKSFNGAEVLLRVWSKACVVND